MVKKIDNSMMELDFDYMNDVLNYNKNSSFTLKNYILFVF